MSSEKQTIVVISLTVKDPAVALDFYHAAFDARELFRMTMPDGAIAHCEFKIGNHTFSMSGEYPDWQAHPFGDADTSPCLFGINVEECDPAFEKAVNAGATVIQLPTDQPWGWRTGIVRDPFGYRWNVRQLLEDLSPEELMDRMKQLSP